MSKWVRADVGDSLRFAFLVKRAESPRLFDWICGLPLRSGPARVRDILERALERVAQRRARAGRAPGLASRREERTHDRRTMRKSGAAAASRSRRARVRRAA